jgi:hypothetical protein
MNHKTTIILLFASSSLLILACAEKKDSPWTVVSPTPTATDAEIYTESQDPIFTEFMTAILQKIKSSKDYQVTITYSPSCQVPSVKGGDVSISCSRVLRRLVRSGYNVKSCSPKSMYFPNGNCQAFTSKSPRDSLSDRLASYRYIGFVQNVPEVPEEEGDKRCEIVLFEHGSRCRQQTNEEEIRLCWLRVSTEACQSHTVGPCYGAPNTYGRYSSGRKGGKAIHKPRAVYPEASAEWSTLRDQLYIPPYIATNGRPFTVSDEFDPRIECGEWSHPLPTMTKLIYDRQTITENFVYIDLEAASFNITVSWDSES